MEESTIDDNVWQYGGDQLGEVVSKEIFKEIVVLRRKLHERPELAFKESFTSTTGEC
jgi:hypothetical protein